MSHIIGLSSIQPHGPDMVYLKVDELANETLFNLDRCLRSVVQNKPLAQWHEFVPALATCGFPQVMQPSDLPVFIHSRPWDEHMTSHGQSFFVAFPGNAPYELAERMLLASPYPQFYAGVSADYLGAGRVVLIDSNHDPIYADDLAWDSSSHQSKLSIGPLILPPEQFASADEHQRAHDCLTRSGYVVLD
jgi:hypothetical protein